MKHEDLRSTDDKICDMLSEGYDFDHIGWRLQMSVYHIAWRFKVITEKLGKQAI